MGQSGIFHMVIVKFFCRIIIVTALPNAGRGNCAVLGAWPYPDALVRSGFEINEWERWAFR